MTRRILWFATAYTIITILHEGAHAVTARALGLEATLFNFWVNIDPAHQATLGQRAAYGAAGPVSGLLIGAGSWLAYRRYGQTAVALPLLYLAAHGVSNFFGNLMSTAFVGDFSNLARAIEMPMGLRYSVSAAGALVTATVLYLAGRYLAQLMPSRTGRTAAAFEGILVPAALGTALVILINQPTPLPGFVAARIGEGVFWLFAATGAFMAPPSSGLNDGAYRVAWWDLGIAALMAVIVRMLMRGMG